MIIQSASVDMKSRRSYEMASGASSTLMTWNNRGISRATTTTMNYYKEDSGTGTSSGEPSFSNSMDDIIHRFKENQGVQKASSLEEKRSAMQIQFQSINYLLHILFGKQVPGNGVSSLLGNGAGATYQGSGGTYTASSYYYESEVTSFSTTGTVKTADGREIDFNLSLSMSRSFEQSYSEIADFGSALNAASLCDPLVINLNSSCANVTDQSFFFDIDADGTLDEINMPTGGSGFLALDKNGDGTINDGSELFGTKSQDGFADLSEYDEDGNGWIDEADSVFEKLKIYSKDKNGKDVLVGLGKAGVGAIYLGNAGTEFSLKDSYRNETSAVVRKTGLFLYENGGAGTIQHVDFAKKA